MSHLTQNSSLQFIFSLVLDSFFLTIFFFFTVNLPHQIHTFPTPFVSQQEESAVYIMHVLVMLKLYIVGIHSVELAYKNTCTAFVHTIKSDSTKQTTGNYGQKHK